VDLTARQEVSLESRSCQFGDQLDEESSGKREKGKIHVASFFNRDLTVNDDYRAFDQGCSLKAGVRPPVSNG
jgi:hypothetical protein